MDANGSEDSGLRRAAGESRKELRCVKEQMNRLRSGGISNYIGGMKTRIVASIGMLLALTAVILIGARAKENWTTQAAPQASAAKTEFDDAGYRKFDEAMQFLKKRNAATFAIKTANGIDESSYVTIGGIEQWVTIRGEDRANPVLLFLHGGPGDVTSPWSYGIFRPWLKYFTLVQWDERGAGRTLAKNGPSIGPTITLDRMTQDGVELTEYLRKHLAKEKIFIVGHSFGTILGTRIVRAKPDLFYAYVGTGQAGDSSRNYFVAYDALVKHAEAVGNQDALEELRHAGPPPYADGTGYRVQWKWANRFERADEWLNGTIGLLLVSPGYSVEDFSNTEAGESLSAEQLVPQTSSLKPKDIGLEFALPVFVIQGNADFTTPTSLAQEYVATLKAPRKEFVTIDGGHFSVFMNSDQFLKELVARVRPIASGK